MNVKRYRPYITTDHHGLCDVADMREDAAGNWVRLSDYCAALPTHAKPEAAPAAAPLAAGALPQATTTVSHDALLALADAWQARCDTPECNWIHRKANLICADELRSLVNGKPFGAALAAAPAQGVR